MHRANVLRAIKQAARHAGLQAEGQEPVGAHDLRHSLAGAAHQAGASLPEIAAMLRHANTHVTAKAYSELFEDRRHAGADKLLASGFGA